MRRTILYFLIGIFNFQVFAASSMEKCSHEAEDKLQTWLKSQVVTNNKKNNKIKDSMILLDARNYIRVTPSERRINIGVCLLVYLTNKGNSSARSELIKFYLQNELTKNKAKKIAMEGAEINDARSQFYLHLLMQEEEIIMGHSKLDYLISSKEQNYMPAICLLGHKYNTGKQPKKGFELMLRAANKNVVACEQFIAEAYLRGLGVEKSYCISYKWALKASSTLYAKSIKFINENNKYFESCPPNGGFIQ